MLVGDVPSWEYPGSQSSPPRRIIVEEKKTNYSGLVNNSSQETKGGGYPVTSCSRRFASFPGKERFAKRFMYGIPGLGNRGSKRACVQMRCQILQREREKGAVVVRDSA